MFQAVLYRKLDEALFAKQEYEDVLTSDVFGAFKYLPPEYLDNWIVKLRDRHPMLTPALKLAQGHPEIEFWPQLQAVKQSANICEPDVVFWWDHLAVVVEAKRASNFEISQLQIERESTHHAAMARGVAVQAVVVAVGRHRPAWWLAHRQISNHWLAFSSWSALADTFQSTLSRRQSVQCPTYEVMLVRDLLSRLEMRDVRPFRGFHFVATTKVPSLRLFVFTRFPEFSGIVPREAVAPRRSVKQIWPWHSALRLRFAQLASYVPTCKGLNIVGEKRSAASRSGPRFRQLAATAPTRLIRIWSPLPNVASGTAGCIHAWSKTPEYSLSSCWNLQTSTTGAIAVGSPSTMTSTELFWTPKHIGGKEWPK